MRKWWPSAMVADRKVHDAKAELNRRSQACEYPDRHRYSRRKKWTEVLAHGARGNAPALWQCASTSRIKRMNAVRQDLFGYTLKKNSQAHRTWFPAITSTVRGLCRQTGFT